MTLRHVEHCMGTVFSITVRTADLDPDALPAVLSWLHWVDSTFSTYRQDSEISRLNRGELTLGQASGEVREILDRAHALSEQTEGYFSAEIDGTLDPSGLVKGWAIERASDLLYRAGSRNHCINGGGDVQCVAEGATEDVAEGATEDVAEGATEDVADGATEGAYGAAPWRIGIADPHDGSQLATVVTGSTIAVATSGTSERGDHIRDPHTGSAPRHLASLTLVGSRLGEVDGLATAAFAMGEGAQSWLAGRDDVRSFAITAEGQRWRTGRWPAPQFDTRPAAPVLHIAAG